MTLDQYLASVRARLDAATPGPWFIEGSEVRGDYDSYATDNGLADCTVRVCEVYRISETLDGAKDDRELIASAPTDLAKLLEMVEVLKIGIEEHLDASPYANECINLGGADGLKVALDKVQKIVEGK